MTDFISTIKRISVEDFLPTLSTLTIHMFNENKVFVEIPVQIKQNGFLQKSKATITAWDLLDIEYLLIKNSSDYRTSRKKISIEDVLALYPQHQNQSKKHNPIDDESPDAIFKMLLGMTSEQFQYQTRGDAFEKYNRNYYILIAAKHFEHAGEIDAEAAMKKEFGWSTQDYLTVLQIMFWICKQSAEPLSVPESTYNRINPTLLTQNNVSKFIEYYSCTYDKLRSSPLGKQFLYAKPFINTCRNDKFILSSLWAMFMLTGNGLYWLTRDYYSKIDNEDPQFFPNNFGLLFEDYIKDLASRYCNECEWQTLKQADKKGADFIFNFGNLKLLIEAKSGLLQLDSKQQEPNISSIDKFIQRHIMEGYEQLNEKFAELCKKDTIPTAKIILLYDDFSNTAIIERSVSNVFKQDNSCFIMTIRQFEILLYLYKNDRSKCSVLFEKIISSMEHESSKVNIQELYNELCINKNWHFHGELDYYRKHLENLSRNSQ